MNYPVPDIFGWGIHSDSWIVYDLPPSCPAGQPDLRKHKQAEGGRTKIDVTQLGYLTPHRTYALPYLPHHESIAAFAPSHVRTMPEPVLRHFTTTLQRGTRLDNGGGGAD